MASSKAVHARLVRQALAKLLGVPANDISQQPPSGWAYRRGGPWLMACYADVRKAEAQARLPAKRRGGTLNGSLPKGTKPMKAAWKSARHTRPRRCWEKQPVKQPE